MLGLILIIIMLMISEFYVGDQINAIRIGWKSR